MFKKIIPMMLCCLLSASILCAQQTSFSTIGTLNPSAQSKLSSQVSGRIERVYVDIGDHVARGDPIVMLEDTLFVIDVAQKTALLEAAKIELRDAQTNLERMKKLWEKPDGESPSISQKRFEDSLLRYEHAKVQVVQAQENLNRSQVMLNEVTVRASFDGVVTKKFVDPGEVITSIPVTNIAEIQSTQVLFLEFSIPQHCLSCVKKGTPVTFEVDGTEKNKYDATIDRIFPIIDEATRSVKCRALIDNSNNIFHPGSLAKVEINIS